MKMMEVFSWRLYGLVDKSNKYEPYMTFPVTCIFGTDNEEQKLHIIGNTIVAMTNGVVKTFPHDETCKVTL